MEFTIYLKAVKIILYIKTLMITAKVSLIKKIYSLKYLYYYRRKTTTKHIPYLKNSKNIK